MLVKLGIYLEWQKCPVRMAHRNTLVGKYTLILVAETEVHTDMKLLVKYSYKMLQLH